MSKKVRVKVFIPTRSCYCAYEAFLKRVEGVLKKYRDQIRFTTYSSHAPEAANYGLQFSKGVVINEKIKFGPLVKANQLEHAILSELNKTKGDE